MKCKNCEQVLEEGAEFCPNCGEKVAKKTVDSRKIIIRVALAVVAVAVAVALILFGQKAKDPNATEPTSVSIPSTGNADDVTCKGSYTVSAEEVASTRDTIVARVGDETLTNGELQMNYWYTVYNFLYTYSNMGILDYIGLDQTKPMDEQISIDGETTWQQFFLRDTISNWHTYVALAKEAEANGYKLNEDQQALLDANIAPGTLLSAAQSGGFTSVAEMIANDMGPGVTEEEYRKFMTLFFTISQYLSDYSETIELTEEEMKTYFESKAETYKEAGIEMNDERYASVRHILISVEPGTDPETNEVVYTDEAWADCLAIAEQVLDEWKKGEATEESFAAMVATYTDDGGSKSNGGLYANFPKGQMVAPFEEWSFDEARQYGDTALVKTDFGYHVMFFVDSRPMWIVASETDLMSQKSIEYLDEVQAKYPIEVDYSAIAFAVAPNFAPVEAAE